MSKALASIRPPFLILTPACISVGMATATYSGTDLNLLESLLIMICALAAHISVNAWNEYEDFNSGLDLITSRTAFSGGSGTLPANPELAATVKMIAQISLIITLLSGLYLAQAHLLASLPIGLLGIVVILAYTPVLNRHALLCLIAPGLAFGPLFIIGTHLILSGEVSALSLLASLPAFFLVNNLLLLNQYPDIAADRKMGRKHLPIRYGLQAANTVYALFAVLAYGSILFGVGLKYFPMLSLISLICLPLSCLSLYGAIRYRADIGSQPGFLASNVAASILCPSLLTLSFVFN